MKTSRTPQSIWVKVTVNSGSWYTPTLTALIAALLLMRRLLSMMAPTKTPAAKLAAKAIATAATKAAFTSMAPNNRVN